MFKSISIIFNVFWAEAKQIFTNESIQMSPEIKCNAEKCMYNSDGICKADYVSISGIGKEEKENTNCETFYK